jgi:hypothetical protein
MNACTVNTSTKPFGHALNVPSICQVFDDARSLIVSSQAKMICRRFGDLLSYWRNFRYSNGWWIKFVPNWPPPSLLFLSGGDKNFYFEIYICKLSIVKMIIIDNYYKIKNKHGQIRRSKKRCTNFMSKIEIWEESKFLRNFAN